MPGLDGTGPMGEGSMTGGARGYCNPGGAGYRPAYGPAGGRGFRRGFGPGYGGGRGLRRGFGWRGGSPSGGGRSAPPYAPYYSGPYGMSREDEVSMLKEDAGMIKAELDAINKRIEELASEPSQT